MGTYGYPDYEILYLNPNGEWVSGFKAHIGAPCFAFYPAGYGIPIQLLE
jgi:hypothetical protein